MTSRHGAPAGWPIFALVHRSAWKGLSRKFVTRLPTLRHGKMGHLGDVLAHKLSVRCNLYRWAEAWNHVP
jgi:hypothetical protein